MRACWSGWRLVVERVATLEELNRCYSLTDIRDANEALDALREAEAPPEQAPPSRRR